MKFMKWRILTVTSLVCLLPIVLGVCLWYSLPETMAIHFDLYGQPDNFASKGFVVFGLPVLMMLLQIVCCVIHDRKAQKYGEYRKFAVTIKWLIPILCFVLQTATLGYSLGWQFEIRIVAALVVSGMFLVIGNYSLRFGAICRTDTALSKAKKINRFIGWETICMGILFLISIFLPPVATAIGAWLLIPYALLSVIYGIIVGRK